MSWHAVRAACLALAAGSLAACASQAPVASTAPPLTPATPVAMVATIRAAGELGEELAVQPLRDPMVEDLREQASTLQKEQRFAEAAAALDQAMALVGDDPALMQERAEAAVLLGEFRQAGELAWRAWQLGARVGPLCRRHWETLHQVRLVEGDAPGAHSAEVQRDACTVADPARY